MWNRGNYTRIDLTNKKFGLLRVLYEVEPVNQISGKPNRRWKVRCDCGVNKEVDQLHLTRHKGGIISCGCISKRKLYKTKGTQHYRRLYHIWFSILSRCNKPNNRDYHKYGGRGISVCSEWHDFGEFYNDMIDTYKPGLTIERLNVNGNYTKHNCTWIPNEQQAKNRRNTVFIDGMCAKDFCKKHSIPYVKFIQRKKYGLDIDGFVKKYKKD